MTSYQSAILIIRNPYDARIATFNLVASNGDHVGFATEEQFRSKSKNNQYYWAWYFGRQFILLTIFYAMLIFFVSEFNGHFEFISHWFDLIKIVVTSGKPFIIIEFGELVNDPIATTLKMVEFLQKHTVISPDHLQQRILCLSQQLNGEHKRKKRKLTIDPFTKVMKEKVNHDVGEARKLLNERSVNFLLPKYEREVLQEIV